MFSKKRHYSSFIYRFFRNGSHEPVSNADPEYWARGDDKCQTDKPTICRIARISMVKESISLQRSSDWVNWVSTVLMRRPSTARANAAVTARFVDVSQPIFLEKTADRLTF
jgi:hypothetical protein